MFGIWSKKLDERIKEVVVAFGEDMATLSKRVNELENIRIASMAWVKPEKSDEVIKGGHLAQLRSGGPIMTVTRAYKSQWTGQVQVDCVWIDKNGVAQKDDFPVYSLKRKEEKSCE